MVNQTGRNIAKGDKEDYVSAVKEFVEGIPANSLNGINSTGTTTSTGMKPSKPDLILASRKKEIPIRVLDRTNDIVYYIDVQEGTEKIPEKKGAICSADSIEDSKPNVSTVYIKLTATDSDDVLRMENTMKYFLKDGNDSIFQKLLPGMFIIEK